MPPACTWVAPGSGHYANALRWPGSFARLRQAFLRDLERAVAGHPGARVSPDPKPVEHVGLPGPNRDAKVLQEGVFAFGDCASPGGQSAFNELKGIDQDMSIPKRPAWTLALALASGQVPHPCAALPRWPVGRGLRWNGRKDTHRREDCAKPTQLRIHRSVEYS